MPPPTPSARPPRRSSRASPPRAVNDEKLGDENAQIAADRADADGVIKLSAGKKRHVLVRVGQAG